MKVLYPFVAKLTLVRRKCGMCVAGLRTQSAFKHSRAELKRVKKNESFEGTATYKQLL